MSERVSFEGSFEALFVKAYKAQRTPKLERELLALGLDLSKLKPAYPYALFLQAMELSAGHYHPGENLESALVKMGLRLVESYFETMMGKPLLAMVRLLGPKRTLMRMKHNFRTANNFSDTELVELGEKHFQMWMNEIGNVRFSTLGVLRRGLELAGANGIKIEIVSTDALGTVYEIWLP
jgi:uncharacterized protein (TIGR02265 family)